MKQITFLLLLLTIYCSIFTVSATPTLQFQHNQTQPGETVLATITTQGEFTQQIEKSQIKFFEGRKQLTLETDILFYNKTHYLYIYTTQEKNLTLRIENILYKESDTLKSTTISKNLTIQKNILTDEETNKTYTQILKIKPGFIFTTTTPQLKLTNIGTYPINLTFNEEEISIPSMSTYELEFTPEKTFSLTEISTYKDFLIPTVYLTSSENTTFISPTIKPDLRHTPESLLVETFTENISQETIQLFNFGDSNITILEIKTNLDFIKIDELENMLGRGIQNLTLEIKPETPGHFQGTINISYAQNETQNTLVIPLDIFVLPKGAPKESFEAKEETCEELSGEVCESGTLCSETPIFTAGMEYCCLDLCIAIEPENKESDGYGWLVGIVILIILGLAGYYFYTKQKRLTNPTPKDALQTTTEKFEKRLAGNQTQRTTGSLTKS